MPVLIPLADLVDLTPSPSKPILTDPQSLEPDLAKLQDGSYVTERSLQDGGHVREEIHKGEGFTSVRITSDGGPGGPMPGGVNGPQDMLTNILNGAPIEN